MGATESKPDLPKPLTDIPWRKPSNWEKELQETLEKDILRLNSEQKLEEKPEQKQKPEQKPNLLLVGPVGAGKSSFINSAISIGKKSIVRRVEVGAGTEQSFTKDYDKYTDNSPLMKHFRFRDCMGIEQAATEGFHVEDMKPLLNGHVKDSYTFNPKSPIDQSNRHYRENPSFEHQIHCIVFIINAAAVYNGLPENYIRKIAELQKQIKGLRIPRVVLLTHTDELCIEVEQNIVNMFRSVKVRDAVKLASEIFHTPPGSIHPIKNYHQEVQLDPMVNIPLLLALKQIMTYADDRFGSAVQSDSE